MPKRYVQQWQAQSNSDPHVFYTVSKTESGEYECSCPYWTRHFPRPECSHIKWAKANPDKAVLVADQVQPIIIPARVRQVTKKENTLLVPLVPIRPDATHFLLTICYDLLKHGVSWSTVRERYRLKTMSKTSLIHYIERYGRCIETEESFKSKIWGFWKTEVTQEGVEATVIRRVN